MIELENLKTGDWVMFIQPNTADAYRIERENGWARIITPEPVDPMRDYFDISDGGINELARIQAYNPEAGFIRPLGYIDKGEMNDFKKVRLGYQSYTVNQSKIIIKRSRS